MTSDEMAAAFGCPRSVAEAIARKVTVGLVCVSRLGPLRVRWNPKGAKVLGGERYDITTSCWMLDGKQATFGALHEAADVPAPVRDPGWPFPDVVALALVYQ